MRTVYSMRYAVGSPRFTIRSNLAILNMPISARRCLMSFPFFLDLCIAFCCGCAGGFFLDGFSQFLRRPVDKSVIVRYWPQWIVSVVMAPILVYLLISLDHRFGEELARLDVLQIMFQNVAAIVGCGLVWVSMKYYRDRSQA